MQVTLNTTLGQVNASTTKELKAFLKSQITGNTLVLNIPELSKTGIALTVADINKTNKMLLVEYAWATVTKIQAQLQAEADKKTEIHQATIKTQYATTNLLPILEGFQTAFQALQVSLIEEIEQTHDKCHKKENKLEIMESILYHMEWHYTTIKTTTKKIRALAVTEAFFNKLIEDKNKTFEEILEILEKHTRTNTQLLFSFNINTNGGISQSEEEARLATMQFEAKLSQQLATRFQELMGDATLTRESAKILATMFRVFA